VRSTHLNAVYIHENDDTASGKELKGFTLQISDHQQSWWYEEGPSKGPGSAGGR